MVGPALLPRLLVRIDVSTDLLNCTRDAVSLPGSGPACCWRGDAWPELRRRHSLAGAAGLLAVPWAAWHLPTFWIDSGLGGFSVLLMPGFFLGIAAGAVVLG